MSKLYLIGKVGYEYNDEIYHRPYNTKGLVEPDILYKDEDKAERICMERNIDELKREDLHGYGYEADDVFLYSPLSRLAKKYNIDLVDDEMEHQEQVFKKLLRVVDEEDLPVLIDTCKIKFYEVYEVELVA